MAVSTQPEMFQGKFFRRMDSKVEMVTSIELMLWFPHETFQPINLPGYVLDVSHGGMKVFLHSIWRGLYHKLLQSTRLVRCCVSDPQSGASIKLAGTLVWFDYHQATEGQATDYCLAGMAINAQWPGAEFHRYLSIVDAAPVHD